MAIQSSVTCYLHQMVVGENLDAVAEYEKEHGIHLKVVAVPNGSGWDACIEEHLPRGGGCKNRWETVRVLGKETPDDALSAAAFKVTYPAFKAYQGDLRR